MEPCGHLEAKLARQRGPPQVPQDGDISGMFKDQQIAQRAWGRARELGSNGR